MPEVPTLDYGRKRRGRVGRVLRGGLLVLGILMLSLMPAGFFVRAGFSASSPFGQFGGSNTPASIALWRCSETFPYPDPFEFQVRRPVANPSWRALLPTHELHTAQYQSPNTTVEWRSVGLPLWTLAILCLAWPVTSFIIARRRHKRGFPVEPKPPDAAVPPPTS